MGMSLAELMAPVEGVSLESYTGIQAQAASLGGDMSQWTQLLASNGLDQPRWERVSGEWNRRMSGQAATDMNDTYALLAEYGKLFGQAGQGQFGASAAANAGTQQAGAGPSGQAPCTLERYAEIMGAQSAWAQQGRDVNAMLKQQFNLSALDWSNLSQYWTSAMMTDYNVAAQVGDLQHQAERQYMAAVQDLDADIQV